MNPFTASNASSFDMMIAGDIQRIFMKQVFTGRNLPVLVIKHVRLLRLLTLLKIGLIVAARVLVVAC